MAIGCILTNDVFRGQFIQQRTKARTRSSVVILLWALCCPPAFGRQPEPAQSAQQRPPETQQPERTDQQPLIRNPSGSKHSNEKPSAKHNTGNARSDKHLTPAAKAAFIRQAQVWAPTDIPAVDFKAGPKGSDAFRPNEMVTCDYVPAKLSGNTRKFDCALPEGVVVKVRYGADNGHVEGSVLATHLLWALGFASDRVYPVRVTCRGCSDDPWNRRQKVPGQHVFDPAVIERKPAGKELEGDKPGWSLPELDLVDEAAGGATKAPRDGLKLLAVMIQHTDTKPEPPPHPLPDRGRLRSTGEDWAA